MEYREIKFRGFSIKLEKWVYGGYVEYDRAFFIFDNDSGNTFINKFASIHKKSRGQFTGEKDRNGKEIYEGDIVKRMADRYDFDKPDGEDHWKEEQISFIEYRSNGFWVKEEDFGYEGENMWDWNQMEVIGNIYENAGLLAVTPINTKTNDC